MKRTVASAAIAVLAAAAFTAAACSSAPPVEPHLVADAERPALLDRTREIVRPHCGECHTSSLATAKPDALAVFDFDREDWGAAMSVSQLAGFHRSIARKLPPEGAEMVEIDAYVGDLLARAAR